ncbi:hypothetical protein VTO58DRAFT_109122 [Aureobasidium pullulans]
MNSRQNRSGDFTASHLPPFPAQASLSGNLYHQPIALPHAFSRRDSTVVVKAYTFSARAYLQCYDKEASQSASSAAAIQLKWTRLRQRKRSHSSHRNLVNRHKQFRSAPPSRSVWSTAAASSSCFCQSHPRLAIASQKTRRDEASTSAPSTLDRPGFWKLDS